MKSISVVTNARLQSTRVPQKLMRPFAGKSLLEIALERLNQLDFFDHRFLAAAEEPIIEVARRYSNVEVLHRKLEAVARGVNPQAVTFAHYREVPSDYIFVLNPCLPFISVKTIRAAYDHFQNTQHPSYTSVVKTGDWVFDSEGNPVTNTDPQNLTTNKNVQFYKAAHAFHIVSKQFFSTQGYHWTFVRDDPHMVEIPEEEYVDVDTMIEFDFAEFMYRNKRVAE